MEKVRHQNPRIRAFLGCIRLLDEVVETDYHLLHCSPLRLREVWLEVRELAAVLRQRLIPALRGSSKIPELEEARRRAATALEMLGRTLLSELDSVTDDLASDEPMALRKLLCVAMGQLQTFLAEGFSRIVAADPRSMHDVEYYLSRRFPRDIEESEWLYETVVDLNTQLQALELHRRRLLEATSEAMIETGELPSREVWNELSIFLVGLYNDLSGRLKEILSLHGVRFEEMSSLNRYAVEIPTRCLKIFEIYELSHEVFQALDDEDTEARRRCRFAVCRRLARLLDELDRTLRDLIAFVPLWIHNLEKRRTLSLGQGAPSRRVDRRRPRTAIPA